VLFELTAGVRDALVVAGEAEVAEELLWGERGAR
jgi:hypothetical protein